MLAWAVPGREKRGALLENNKPPFWHTCIRLWYKCMYLTYCYHCEGPHTLYYNDRHTFLFLSLSLSIIKKASQIQHPDTAYDFWNIQTTGINLKALFIKNLQTKFHQNRTRNKEVVTFLVIRWKSRKFRKLLLSGLQFSTFRLFIVILKVHDERNWMTTTWSIYIVGSGCDQPVCTYVQRSN